MLGLVKTGRCWIKLSGAYRTSDAAPDWLDMTPYAQALIETRADRMVWASDWPFAGFEGQVSYSDAIAALHRWVPDAAMRHAIGGRTPLQLYFT